MVAAMRMTARFTYVFTATLIVWLVLGIFLKVSTASASLYTATCVGAIVWWGRQTSKNEGTGAEPIALVMGGLIGWLLGVWLKSIVS